MSWSKNVSVRVNMPYLKGRIKDIPGEQIEMQDEHGNALCSGFHMKITGIKNVQPDPTKAQYAEASVLVVKSTDNGKRESYTIRVPVSRLCEDLPSVIRSGVGPDARFEDNDPLDKLLLVICAASVDPQNAPTYTTPSYIEGDSWYWNGKRVGPAAEISRLVNDPESNATLYVLRAKRLTGEGWAFSKPITWDQLQKGDYCFTDGRNTSVSHPTLNYVAMESKWSSLTEGQRNSQMLEERNQPAADKQRAMDRAFGFRGDAHSR